MMTAERPRETRHVFETLDGMRGIAAICVAFMHAQVIFGVWPYSGFLAVDFFFVLSGFVISYAYEDRIREGLNPFRFALIRLIRLYPLYILGVALALGERFIGGALHLGPPATLNQVIGWSTFEALFLPVPAVLAPEANHLFPGIFPAWSLFFEMFANILYGFVGRYLTNRRLLVLVLLAAALLIEQIVTRGTIDGGGSEGEATIGFARVLFSFFAGVGIKRLYFSGKVHLRAWPTLCFPVLVLLLFGPTTGSWVVAYQIVCVIAIFPGLVLLFAFARAKGFERTFLLQLGIVSYPIYILHAPLFFFITRVSMHFHADTPAMMMAARVVYIGGVLVGAALADRFYDRPVRKALTRRLVANR